MHTETTTSRPEQRQPVKKSRWATGLALPLRTSLIILAGATVLGLLASLILGPKGPAMSGGAGDPALLADAQAKVSNSRGFKSLSVMRISDGQTSFAGLGSPDDEHPDPPSPQTRYELGSITKTFTALLLADAIDRGEITLDDTLASQLPELQGTEAGSVTIAELAEHRSGLPRLLPSQMAGALVGSLGTANPYDMGTTELLAQAREVPLAGRGEYAYSNLGVALLGHALARAGDASSWPELAQSRLFEPLGMNQTNIATNRAEVPADGVRGYRQNGRMPETWYGQGYTPMGCCTWTTTADMARYAQALLDNRAPGMAALEPRAEAGKQKIGMLWMTAPATDDESEVVWHNGGTGGGMTWFGLDRAAGTATLVMGNSGRSVDALGKSLLTGRGDAGTPMPPLVPAGLMLLLGGCILRLVFLAGKADRVSRVVGVTLDVWTLGLLTAVLGPWQLVPGWTFGALAGLGVGALALAALRARSLPWATKSPRMATASVVLSVVLTIAISVLVLAL